MSITVEFFSFTKRKNSTAIPTGAASRTASVLLKEDTNIENPIFILQTASIAEFALYNYIHVSDFGRYYFIDSRTYKTGSQIEIVCSEDVLASFKSEITGITGAFIDYCSVANITTPDPRIGSTAQTHISRATGTFGATNFMSDGCAIISSIGTNGTGLFIFGAASQIYPIFDGAGWENVTDPSSTDIATALVEIGGGLIDMAEQFFVNEAASKNLRAAFSLPWIPQPSAVGAQIANLEIGNMKTGVSCHKVAKEIITDTCTVSIPWQFNDWRRSAQHCKVIAFLPLFGLVELPVNSIRAETQVNIKYAFCYSNGDVSFEIKAPTSGEILATGSVNAASPLAIGSSNINVAKAAVGAVAASVAVGALGMALMPEAGASISAAAVGGGLTGAVGGTASVAGALMGETYGTSGGFGGYSAAELTTDPTVFVIASDLTDQPANVAAQYGYPTFKIGNLSGLTGYTKLQGYMHRGTGSKLEMDTISAFLNRGFYIE